MTCWHEESDESIGPAVARLIEGYKTEQKDRRGTYLRYLHLYEGKRPPNYAEEDVHPDRLGLIKSAVGTAVSSIYAPQKPKPQFQTLGATWATRRKAYKLDRICEGVLNQRQASFINVWAFMIDAAQDAALQGLAAIKVVADTEAKRIDHQLIPTYDIFADPREGRNPRSLFQIEPISETAAKERWPHLQTYGGAEYEYIRTDYGSTARNEKMLELQFAYHLPASDDEPGKWAAVVGGQLVDSGEWTAPWFPFVFLYWDKSRDSIYGHGIADEGAELALIASDLDFRLQCRMRVASRKLVFYEEGSCNPDDLTRNDELVAVAIQPQAGFPPTEVATPPFSPVEIKFVDDKVRQFWDAIGISQVSAAARREQGVSSGVAMMTLNDTKQGRQLLKSQRYEQAYVDLAHQYVWRLRELAEEDPNFAIEYPGKSLLRAIKWDTADPDDLFTVTVAPASSLPHDPAGRQQMVQSLFESGVISAGTFKQLLGWPDFDSELTIENSESEYIDSLIERYLDADEEDGWDGSQYEPPEGFVMDKMGALRRFASAWFRARIDQQSLPEKEKAKAEFCIGLLSQYMEGLDQLLTPPEPEPAAAPPEAAPALPPEAMPPAQPIAPPQAEIGV